MAKNGDWSTWRGSSSELTVGIEEELMLLDPRDWSLAFRSDEVLDNLPEDLRERVTLETHAAVMEISTGVHRAVSDAVAELADLRERLSRGLAEQGLRAAVAGTHPCATADETVVSSHPRYSHMPTRCACSRCASPRWPRTSTSASRRPPRRSGS